MKIHANWIRTTEPTPRVEKEQPVQNGIPPMECEACHDYYVPKRAGQKYCTRPECVTRRDRQRQQERRQERRQRNLPNAERKEADRAVPEPGDDD